MGDHRKLDESPKERLARLVRSCRPSPRELRGPGYLVAVGLLLLLTVLVAIGIVAGMLGSEIVAQYAGRIWQWASSAGRGR